MAASSYEFNYGRDITAQKGDPRKKKGLGLAAAADEYIDATETPERRINPSTVEPVRNFTKYVRPSDPMAKAGMTGVASLSTFSPIMNEASVGLQRRPEWRGGKMPSSWSVYGNANKYFSNNNQSIFNKLKF